MSCEKLRALLIEAHPSDVDVLTAQLAESGIDLHVTQARRLRDAIGQLTRCSFDLVFLNLLLPDCDGLAVFGKLREHEDRLPVIVLVAPEAEGLGLAAVQRGAQDYLIKGQIDGRWLGRSVRTALERQRLTNQLAERASDLTQRHRQLSLEAAQRQDHEKAFREQERQLLQKQKMEAIGTLSGGVAHEFNNLLQAIRGYTTFASEGLLPDSQRHSDLQQAIKATDRAAALTRQLLSFSRTEELSKHPVNLGAVIDDTIQLLRPLIGEHIDVQADTHRCQAQIWGELTLIQQLLLNLCINARDAMPEGGTLTVLAEDVHLDAQTVETHPLPPGSYAVLKVSDTGCGIRPEVQQRMFEPFFTTKSIGKGTGLGLSVVYNVVRQHDGSIQVESQPGRGSTFTVFLPLVTAEQPGEPSQESSADVGGTETILLAEDEPLVREVATRILRKAGYQVIVAREGEEALRLFERNRTRIELAILDLAMPKLHGWQVAQALQDLRADIPIVFCSGHEGTSGEALAARGWQLIHKPFDTCTFLQTVRAVLDDHRDPLRWLHPRDQEPRDEQPIVSNACRR